MSAQVLAVAQGGSVAGHPLWHFALVAGAGLVTFAAIKATEWWKQSGRQLFKPSRPMVVLALLSLAAGWIHGVLCPEHFREWVVYGAFFAGAAALQGIWSVLVLHRPTRLLLTAGALGNAVVVGVFVVSRTVGIPFGPEALRAEGLTGAGVVATLLELAVVAGALHCSSHLGGYSSPVEGPGLGPARLIDAASCGRFSSG